MKHVNPQQRIPAGDIKECNKIRDFRKVKLQSGQNRVTLVLITAQLNT